MFKKVLLFQCCESVKTFWVNIKVFGVGFNSINIFIVWNHRKFDPNFIKKILEKIY